MSSPIDSKVVEAKFDNKQFQAGVSETMSSLEKLKHGLKLDGATKGLEGVGQAAGKLNLGGITNAVESVKNSFSALSVVAVTALATIAHAAVSTAGKVLNSFSFGPLKAGLEEYETNLNSVQTILANTGLKGQEGLNKVNGALKELNDYSDQTIYNFSEMARNIGTFTAAGVKLDTATGAIKGIANLAAVSGSNSQQASTAMYQLSQAMSTGTVKLMDWNSVVNAGMGGKVFQDAIKETARAHGVGVDAIIKKEGSFRDSLQTGWLSAEILTDTLQKFTGDMTASQLKQMGYTDKQIEGILEMGRTAKDAATKVKTFTQLMGTLKEAAGSGWAQTWQLVLGDFDQAKTLWTNVNNVLGGAISASAEARNEMLKDWAKLGGRTAMIDAAGNAFKALISVLKPIKDAFREIFPAKTGRDLYEITVAVRDFMKNLEIGSETADKVKRIFAGFFAIFSIAKQVIVGVVEAVGDLVGAFGGDAAGGILDFAAKIGDFLVHIDKLLKSSNGVEDFFNNLEGPIGFVLSLLQPLIRGLEKLFGLAPSSDQLIDAFGKVGIVLSPLEALGIRVQMIFKNLAGIFTSMGKVVGNAIANIGSAIGKFLTPGNFEKTLDVINTALLGGIVVLLKRFFSGGMNVDIGGGFLSTAKDALEQLTGTMKLMQTQIKADILIKIAGALALLTASIFVLSRIDSKDLAKALVTMGIGFVGLQAALVSLSASISTLGALKLPFIVASLMGLAASLTLMAVALKIMATMNFGEMMRGIVGFAAALKVISIVMKTMPKNMVGQAAALTILGVALNAIAVALKLFATIDWDDMGRGLAAMAGALVILAGAMHLMPKGMILQAAALTVLGVALNAIAVALKVFGTISWDSMAHGMVALAGALIIIAGAMHLMPNGVNMLLQAAALTVLGVALNGIALAIKLMATMSWEEIGKGLVTLGGALLILAVGLNAMNGAVLGAAALLVAAGALAVLTPILIALGNLKISTIVTGLAALAGIFVVLGVAGMVLAPLTPVLMGLSVAFVLFGAGLALAGVGLMAIATAFGIVVGAGMAGVQILHSILDTFMQSLPGFMEAFGEGVIRLAEKLAEATPTFFKMFIAILESMIKAIVVTAPKIAAMALKLLNEILDLVIKAAPKFAQAFLALIDAGLKVLTQAVPKMARAGLEIITGVLQAISDKLPRIMVLATEIIVKFIQGITAGLPKIIDSGVKLIISFVNGVADAIDKNSRAMGEAGGRLAVAIVEGMAKGIAGGLSVVTDAAKNLAQSALNAAKDFLGISSPSKEFFKMGEFSGEGLANGLDSYQKIVAMSAADVGDLAVMALRESLSSLSNVLDMDVDMRPVIAPVLDLSDVQRDAKQLSSLLTATPIAIDASYSKAKDASAGHLDNQNAEQVDWPSELSGPGDVTFVQNNYSPKALSSAEIYRQTGNQISKAKEALT